MISKDTQRFAIILLHLSVLAFWVPAIFTSTNLIGIESRSGLGIALFVASVLVYFGSAFYKRQRLSIGFYEEEYSRYMTKMHRAFDQIPVEGRLIILPQGYDLEQEFLEHIEGCYTLGKDPVKPYAVLTKTKQWGGTYA